MFRQPISIILLLGGLAGGLPGGVMVHPIWAQEPMSSRERVPVSVDDNEALRQKITSLEAVLAAEQSSLAEATDRFGALRHREAEIRDQLAAAYQGLENIETNIRLAGRETMDLLASSLVSPQNPGRFDPLTALTDSDRAPGFDRFRAMVDVLFDEMDATGRIESRQGTFIDLSGRTVEGPVLRAGGLTTYYRQDQTVGFLRPLDDGRRQLALPARPSKRMTADINRFIDGDGDALPLDLTNGAAFEHLGAVRDWRDWLHAGGVLVWPIILLGAIAGLLILERLVFLGRLRGNTDRVLDQVRALAAKGDWDACRRLCRDGKAPACRVMEAGLDHRDRSWDVLDNALQEAVMKQMPRLERFLPTLNVLAAVAPLLGLLGTVTGMIETFQVITIFGSGDPRLMAGGISEALITTQLGLAVALPIMMIHHYLERRVDRIVDDMEEKGAALLGVVCLKGATR